MYYFAYGSNLNYKQMNCRCPDNKYIARAYLDNYKFVYVTGDGSLTHL